jgi:hypothetical protein
VVTDGEPATGPVDSAIQQSSANSTTDPPTKSEILHWISQGIRQHALATHGIMESYFHIEKQEMLEAA